MMSKPVASALLTAAAIAVAGCGGGTSESDVITAEPAISDSVIARADTNSAAADTVAYQVPQDAAAAAPQTLQLRAVGNTDASGQVMIREVGAQEVEIAISMAGGAVAGQRYAGVYRGTCENPETIVEPLQHVGAGATGRSTTTLQLPLAQLMAGGHVVIVRSDATEQAQPVACVPLGPAAGESAGEMDHDEH